MSNIEITGVSRDKKGTIIVLYRRKIGKFSVNYKATIAGDIPHPDFIKAFERCTIHLALLGEFVQTEKEDIDKFYFAGFSIAGKEDDPGFTLSGYKILSTKRAMIFNTPFTKFVDSESQAYEFVDVLEELFDSLKEEALNFMTGKKKGDDPQGSLFDENEGKIHDGPPDEDDEEPEEGEEGAKEFHRGNEPKKRQIKKKVVVKKAANKVAPKKAIKKTSRKKK